MNIVVFRLVVLRVMDMGFPIFTEALPFPVHPIAGLRNTFIIIDFRWLGRAKDFLYANLAMGFGPQHILT